MRRGLSLIAMMVLPWLGQLPHSSAFAPALTAAPVSGSLSADFNGDGYADLAAGAPGESVGSVSAAGAVNALYGAASGLQAASPDDQLWTQNIAGVRDSAESDDEFGSSLANGDFNGDGYGDLAIGVPREDVAGTADAGAAAVLYGSIAGLQANAPDDQFWTQNSPGVEDSAEAFDLFGSSLAAADFNGDGFTDLALGAQSEDTGSISDAGGVNVLYGSIGGLQTSSPADQLWTQDSAGVQDSAEAGDGFGYSLAGGDFNEDGFDDLVIGVPFEDLGVVLDGGSVSILYGSAGGLQADGPDDQFWNQDSPGILDSPEDVDRFGWAVAAGDFNGDGFVDLSVGTVGEDVGPVVDAGAVSVIYGSVGGLQADSPDDQFWNQDSPGVQDLAEDGDSFGAAAGAGDFSADGFSDLAVGVELEDIGTVQDAGAVTILYGSSSGLQADAPEDQFWNQDSPGVRDRAERSDAFASVLLAADFNGDEATDLAVGVPDENLSLPDVGAVEALYGSTAGLQADLPEDQFWTQNSAGVKDASEPNDALGHSLG